MAIGRPRRKSSIPAPHPIEIISLRTSSGQTLAVEVRQPKRPARATVILLHSMMASRKIWDSPRDQGFVTALNDAGLRTLALDFRGHGESRPTAAEGNQFTYDALVREDVPALCLAARERWPRERLSIVGHSLGGHVAVASVATGAAEPDALVVLATNIWMPSEEPSPILRAKKAGLVRFCQIATRARGYFPARALGRGSDDEAQPLMSSWISWWQKDHWTSDDGRVDYFEAMSRIKVPLLAIGSMGDRYLCTPAGGARFAKHAPPDLTTFELVRRADDGGAAPDHMQLVTTRGAASYWERVAEFCGR